MNLIWFFCLYMTFIYMPFDLFLKPVEIDEEVWFGVTLKGQHVCTQRHARHLTMVIGSDPLGAGRHGHHLILM